MTLENILSRFKARVKREIFIPDTREEIKRYLIQNTLANHFDNAPDDKKQKFEEKVDNIVDRVFGKYERDLNSLPSRLGGTIGAALGINELVSGSKLDILLEDIPDATYFYMVGKTLMELPHVYSYLKNNLDLHGLYGIVKYGLQKAIGIWSFALGPIIEGPALKRLFVDRIIYESAKEFNQYIGVHEPLYSKVKSWVGKTIGAIKGQIKGNIDGLPLPYNPQVNYARA